MHEKNRRFAHHGASGVYVYLVLSVSSDSTEGCVVPCCTHPPPEFSCWSFLLYQASLPRPPRCPNGAGLGAQDGPFAGRHTQHRYSCFYLQEANDFCGFPSLPGVISNWISVHPYTQELFLKHTVKLSAWLLQLNLRGGNTCHTNVAVGIKIVTIA